MAGFLHVAVPVDLQEVAQLGIDDQAADDEVGIELEGPDLRGIPLLLDQLFHRQFEGLGLENWDVVGGYGIIHIKAQELDIVGVQGPIDEHPVLCSSAGMFFHDSSFAFPGRNFGNEDTTLRPLPVGKGPGKMLKKPVQMVLFDYGNVIARVSHRRFEENLAALGPIDRDALHSSIFAAPNPFGVRFETGLVDREQFFRHVAGFFQEGTLTRENLVAAFCDIFEPILPTQSLIPRLVGHYRIGLLSNTNVIHYEEVIRKVGVFPCFDQVTLSFEVGAMKPDPRIFRDALDKFGGPADAVVYLDDIAEFVAAASRLGIQARHVVEPDRVMADLERDLLGR